MEYDLSYSIIVIGDLGVGKTSIVKRYLKNTFMKAYLGTWGTRTYTKTINVNYEEAVLGITDMRGIKYVSPISHFYKEAQGVIIVYDVTRLISFHHIRNWYRTVAPYTKVGTVFMVVGNKSDLTEEREIDKKTAEIYARSCGHLFMETSALLNENIENVFQTLADELYFRKIGIVYHLQNMSTSTKNESMIKNLKPYPMPKVYSKPKPCCKACCGRPLWRVLLGIPYRCGLGQR